MSRPASAQEAFDILRNESVQAQPHLLESTDPRCKGMQENARGKDEGERRENEESTRLASLPHSSALAPLSARQLTAINLLTMGKSVVATAASIKVDPSTIHRWKSGNALFIAELNRRQHDTYDAIVVQLRATMLEAVSELHRLMSDGLKSEKREVMWKMLSFLRPQKLLEPTSPTEARDVIDQKIREGRARRGEIVEVPIEEEDRIAWVSAQERSSGTGYQPVNETAETRARKIDSRDSGPASGARVNEYIASGHPEENHVPEARATARRDGTTAKDGDAECSEASGEEVQAAAAKASAPSPRHEILREYALDDSAIGPDRKSASDRSISEQS